jgi:hypothetical protein
MPEVPPLDDSEPYREICDLYRTVHRRMRRAEIGQCEAGMEAGALWLRWRERDGRVEHWRQAQDGALERTGEPSPNAVAAPDSCR